MNCQALQQLELWDRAMEARLLTAAGCRLPAVVSTAPTRLPLKSLTSAAEYVAPEAIESAVNLCPDATSVVLSNSWLPSEALYKVRQPCAFRENPYRSPTYLFSPTLNLDQWGTENQWKFTEFQSIWSESFQWCYIDRNSETLTDSNLVSRQADLICLDSLISSTMSWRAK